jgi:hypothetical protein
VATDDTERLQAVRLHNMGVIPQGIELVPAQERYVMDGRLGEGVLSLTRQTMQEHVTSYLASADTGTDKEQTATEVSAKISVGTAMLQGMMGQAYIHELDLFKEVARRAFRRDSRSKEALALQKRLQARGVPEAALKEGNYEVMVSRSFGGGDVLMGKAAANDLLTMRGLFGEGEGRQILRTWVEVTTGDPDVAHRLVPEVEAKQAPSAEKAAEACSRLFQSIPVTEAPQGLEAAGYVVAILGLCNQRLQLLAGDPGASTADIMGVTAALEHAAAIIQGTLVAVPGAQPVVKALAKQAAALNKGAMALMQQRTAGTNGTNGNQGQQMQAAEQAEAEATQADIEARLQVQRLATEKARTEKEQGYAHEAQVDATRAEVEMGTELAAVAGGVQPPETGASE